MAEELKITLKDDYCYECGGGYRCKEIDLILGTIMEVITEDQRNLPVFNLIKDHLAAVNTIQFLDDQMRISHARAVANYYGRGGLELRYRFGVTSAA